MEVSALKPAALSGLRGPTPLLRLQSDERLVALTRRGNQSAFETLVARYQARLLAFCRHMLNSREDAEDVLQEVFAAAFNAMVAHGITPPTVTSSSCRAPTTVIAVTPNLSTRRGPNRPTMRAEIALLTPTASAQAPKVNA